MSETTRVPSRLVVISGPSGSGKTTICRRLVEDARFELSVSATTRERRKGEVDGESYHFLPAEDFERRVREGDFLEHAEYNGNRYGTLRSEVEKRLDKGRFVILEIEVQGTRQLQDNGVEALYFFVMPPSPEELERRLRDRQTESEEVIARRLQVAQQEMTMTHLYDHVLINEDLETAVEEARTRIAGA